MSTPTSRTRLQQWMDFLSSMNLAITLLVAVAIASVIGTVLQQGQTYQSYIVKFGPFWFELFRSLELNDVYTAYWFIAILGFLLISTTVCIYRNTPSILRDMRQFRLNVALNSLRAFHHKSEWNTNEQVSGQTENILRLLQRYGCRVRMAEHDDHTLLAGMKGSYGRLGYFFTHTAIVVICVGGLIDGNLPLKLAELSGRIEIETRDIPASEVPDKSKLAIDNPSFRGSVNIPEGERANVAFLRAGNGYLVQKLPFSIELRDFRIEHYPSGQPKSFESDLVIHDETLDAPIEKTIAVNHPWIYRGYAIYQASFNDGGSNLSIKAWPLRNRAEPSEFKVSVNQTTVFNGFKDPLTLEADDFRLYNINPVDEKETGKKFRNFGPSFTFKLRRTDGTAREYVNYMVPVDRDGRQFFISGMRESVGEEFRYLYIPVDSKNSLERYTKFIRLLNDDKKIREVTDHAARNALKDMDIDSADTQKEMSASMQNLLNAFLDGGFQAVVDQVEQNIPAEKREAVTTAYMKVLQMVLGSVYVELLNQEGIDTGKEGISEKDSLFFDEAVDAMNNSVYYGAPFYLQLTDFTHIQATGLQVTRSPGKNIVYFGCVLLITGIFMMFYLPHRRFWVRLSKTDSGTAVLFAGSGHRNPLDFEREFTELEKLLKRL